MKQLKDCSVAELRQLISLKEQIETLQNQLQAFGDERGNGLEVIPEKRGRRRTSASARRKIGLAQKARWAKRRGAEPVTPPTKKRRMSAAGRARIAAAAKARWAKIRAAKEAT
ncbi:MAG: hypothetical protein ACLQU4_15005 [Limisphaerales bacterium]